MKDLVVKILSVLLILVLFLLLMFVVNITALPKIQYEFIKEVRMSDSTLIHWAFYEYKKDGRLYREKVINGNPELVETFYSFGKDKHDNPIAVMENYNNKEYVKYLLYRTYDKYGNWIQIEKVKADYRFSFYYDEDLPARSALDEVYSVIKRDITYRD